MGVSLVVDALAVVLVFCGALALVVLFIVTWVDRR